MLSLAEAERASQIVKDGTTSEFWLFLSEKIMLAMREAEHRFVDNLAKDYDDYVKWWSRRNACKDILDLPTSVKHDADTLRRE